MAENIKPGKKILIIDDDKLIAAMEESILGEHDFNIRRACDGEEGIRVVKEWHPDLIVLDFEMPGMDGPDVCEVIRGLPLPHRPSILIVSSLEDKKTISYALTKGADDFLVKPADELEFVARVNAQLRIGDFYREIENNKKKLETIHLITKAVGASLDTSAILSIIVKEVAGVIGASRCSIVLIHNDGTGYVLASHEDPEVVDLRINLANYPEIQEVIRTKRPLTLEDISSHPIMSSLGQPLDKLQGMSVLVVPIVFEEHVLGTLFLRARREEKRFTEKEMDFCRIIANASFHALKNAKTFEEINEEKKRLSNIAITDQLTNLYNHNFFYTRLEEEFERTMRYGGNVSLIMMDIDNFKRINDTHGHREGDKVLKAVSHLIKSSVRKSDIVSRYGGEEFTVILPQTTIEGAVGEAERIRALVEGYGYIGLHGENITVSSGVAACPNGKVKDAGGLVSLADRALYLAKDAGKNCVRSIPELSESPSESPSESNKN